MSRQVTITIEGAAALLGRQGGHARAAALSPEERSASARRAVETRWAKERGEQMNGKRLRWQDAPGRDGKRARLLKVRDHRERGYEVEGAEREPDEDFKKSEGDAWTTDTGEDPGEHVAVYPADHQALRDGDDNLHIFRAQGRHTTDTKPVPMSARLKKLNEAQRAFWKRKS